VSSTSDLELLIIVNPLQRLELFVHESVKRNVASFVSVVLGLWNWTILCIVVSTIICFLLTIFSNWLLSFLIRMLNFAFLDNVFNYLINVIWLPRGVLLSVFLLFHPYKIFGKNDMRLKRSGHVGIIFWHLRSVSGTSLSCRSIKVLILLLRVLNLLVDKSDFFVLKLD